MSEAVTKWPSRGGQATAGCNATLKGCERASEWQKDWGDIFSHVLKHTETVLATYLQQKSLALDCGLASLCQNSILAMYCGWLMLA
jgi:hypothetical protein